MPATVCPSAYTWSESTRFTSARGITNSRKQLHKGPFALIKLPWCPGRTNKRKKENCQPSFHISEVETKRPGKTGMNVDTSGRGRGRGWGRGWRGLGRGDWSKTEVPGLLVRGRDTEQTVTAKKLLMLVAFSFSSRLGTCLLCINNFLFSKP